MNQGDRKKKRERDEFEQFLKISRNTFDSYDINDKPDVHAMKDGLLYGIELTKGYPEEFLRARDLAKKQGMQSFCSSSLEDNPKAMKRSNSELEKVISEYKFVKSEISGVAWANRVAQRILEKAEGLKNGEIKRFDRNWLVVTDLLQGIRPVDHEFHRAALMASLGASYLTTPGFDITFVLCLQVIFIIDKSSVRTEILPAS